MYTLSQLQKYTKCNDNGRNHSGKVVALSNYVGTQQVCFLLENDKMGTWMPIESLLNLKESDTEDTVSESDLEIEIEEEPEKTESPNKSEIDLILEDIQSHPKIVEIRKQATPEAWEKLIEWITVALLKLDLGSALQSVKRLKKSCKHEVPREIAQILTVHKSLQTAGFTGIKAIPTAEDIISRLLGIDLPDVAKIAAEMVYQIGFIYNRSSKLRDRLIDIVIAFGIALLGDNAIDAGIAWLKSNPILKAGMSASAKAVMIYAIGHAACIYYENSWDSFISLKEANEPYLADVKNENDVKQLIDSEIEEAYTIDYTYLSEYLKKGKWKKADIETGLIIQELIYRNEEVINFSSVNNLIAEDIQEINKLWRMASKQKFGFSSQQQIYKEVREKIGDFGEKVEWRGKAGNFGGAFGWKSYDSLSFKDDAPKGHLPACWLRIAPGLNGGSKIENSLKAILDRDDWQ